MKFLKTSSLYFLNKSTYVNLRWIAYIGQITTGASDDIQKLTQLGYSYVSIYGMDDEISTINYQSDIE